ncbi:MAG: hypothetical protein AABW99_04070 [archaeon]
MPPRQRNLISGWLAGKKLEKLKKLREDPKRKSRLRKIRRYAKKAQPEPKESFGKASPYSAIHGGKKDYAYLAEQLRAKLQRQRKHQPKRIVS